MTKFSILALLLILSAACQPGKPISPRPDRDPTIFEVVISDLVAKEPINPKFVGSKVMVISGWNDGDSLYFNLEDYDIMVSDELLDALKSTSESQDPFPDIEAFGPNATITSDQPLNYLEYYGDDVEPVQGKCFVSFWRPGFSKDRKRAIVRVSYGPKSHEIVITYLLSATDTGWTILGSFLLEYP